MKRFLILILVYSCVAMSLGSGHRAHSYETLYRVVYTTPAEVVKSLRMPLGTIASFHNSQSTASRLDRYYKIMGKKVDGNSIDLQILLLGPSLPDIFKEPATIQVFLREVKLQNKNYFFYNGRFQNKFIYVDADLKVSPHIQGSLLEIIPTKSDIPNVVLNGLFLMATQLGFSKSP